MPYFKNQVYEFLQAIVRSSRPRPEVFCQKGEASNFIKNETLAQVFFCEFCEISKNAFF